MRLFRTVFLAAVVLLALPGVAAAHDRNHDGLPDGWEKANHLSLKVKQANRDQDRDGLRNRGEFRHGTNPRRADSDGDGLRDGAEVETGNNPRKDDTDGDGRDDGQENAGKVTDFTNGVLTITLADGSTIKGAVTPQTEVKCEGAAEDRARMASDGDGDHGDDNHRGEDNRGGDDNQGDDDNNDGDHNDNASPCTIAVGDFVHEADLKATSSGPVFEEVELAK